ncbi:MAG: patatin-like phospholipase family protein [Holosporales bacterium]|nr:patatin-like phospholipase family protein [Holosporales bacterium]
MYRTILSLILISIPALPAMGMLRQDLGNSSDHGMDGSEGVRPLPLQIQINTDEQPDSSETPKKHKNRRRGRHVSNQETGAISGPDAPVPHEYGSGQSGSCAPLPPRSFFPVRPRTLSGAPQDQDPSLPFRPVSFSTDADGPLELFPHYSLNGEESILVLGIPRLIGAPSRETPVVIFSIDGGGIRGLIPAYVLARIEEITGRPISRLANLIAGTSTGGILALGLTVPEQGNPRFSARDLLRLYQEQGNRVFSKRRANFGGVLKAKYKSGPFEELLASYFGETTLADSLTHTLVTGFDIERQKPKIFKTSSARADALRNFLMRDVARATSAAPTYFKPAKISSTPNSSGDRQEIVAVDGGLCANNPALCALCEARLLYPDASEYIVISLGTGRATVPLFYRDARDMSILGWGMRIPGILIDGPADLTDHLMRVSGDLPQERLRYRRLQVELQAGNAAMDDISSQNIATLLHRAEAITGTSSFQDVVRLLGCLPDALERHESLGIDSRRFSIM